MTTDNTANNETVEERLATLEERIDELEEENQRKDEKIDELEEELENRPTIEYDESDPLGTLEIDGIPLGRVIKSKASDSDVEYVEEEVEEIKSDLEGGSPTAKGGGSTAESDVSAEELTEVEKLAAAGDPDDLTDIVEKQRAITLFKNLTSWGRKAPKGYVLTASDNPKKLLEADRDENLCWKQYNRAARRLESMSEGAVTFVSPDKKGKRLILHESSDVYDRSTNGTLSVSTVEVPG